jgi:hypothetical protein
MHLPVESLTLFHVAKLNRQLRHHLMADREHRKDATYRSVLQGELSVGM